MTVLSAINVDDDVVKHVLPVGLMVSWAGDAAPTGWVLCAGQAISRTGANAALFALLGTTYGTGDGSTTFNLPDCRGRLVIGPDDMDGTAAGRMTGAVLGSVGGIVSHTLTSSEMPVHNHGGVTGGMSANASHYHLGADVDRIVTNNTAAVAGLSSYSSGQASLGVSSANIDHSYTATTEGSATSHSNIQPSLATHIIVKI